VAIFLSKLAFRLAVRLGASPLGESSSIQRSGGTAATELVANETLCVIIDQHPTVWVSGGSSA
jgi:hypothetical protein